MKNIAIILALLMGPAALARLSGASAGMAGSVGMAAVFAFTALGHFIRRDDMAQMIPPWMPARPAIVIVSGLFEAALAVLLLTPSSSRIAGMATCVFLVLVTPVNVYAALKRIDFGGHAAGPAYLLARLPLQALLIAWTYWFCVRAG
jgi:uncharacterized membrane protein